MNKLPNLVLPIIAGVALFAGSAFFSNDAEAECVVGVKSNDVLNVRSGPGTNYPIIGSLRPNQCDVEVYKYELGWAHISNFNGYVSSKFLHREDDGGDGGEQLGYTACVRGVQTNDVLNIRSGASTGSRIVGVIPPKACDVEVFSEGDGINGFVRIKYKGITGWAAERFLYVL